MYDITNNIKDKAILYVEDENAIRTNVHICLKYIFNNVITAVNGEEGLKKFKEEKIDLIITDVNMPNKNGIDMIKDIKKIQPDVPCIVTSASTQVTSELVKAMGISKHIKKPFLVDELIGDTIKLLNKEFPF